MNPIEQLARDLLARLSHDYGDSEDCPPEVQALFDRGEQLLPVKADDPYAAARHEYQFERRIDEWAALYDKEHE